jgi:hypothetical protein
MHRRTPDDKPTPAPPGHPPSLETHRCIVVCTDKRGVFFGYVPNLANSPSNESMLGPGVIVKLERARMAVYWTSAERGVFGLAAKGPGAGCRIGPPATITVKDVHAVFDVENPEAVARWEEGPWG